MRKSRVLIVSKFLYVRGGAEVCAINQAELLRRHGHEVRFFAMRYPENIETGADVEYFAPEVSFFQPSFAGKLTAAARVFGAGVKAGFEKMLDDFKPDIVHLHNIHSYLSPIVARIAHQRGIKVLWTLHDYKLLCPSYACLRQGKPCELCFTDKSKVVSLRCMKGSLSASLLAWAEAVYWNKKKLSAWTDAFIGPSRFMAQKMVQGGFPKAKVHSICNFISDDKLNLISEIPFTEKEQAYAYVGRLSEEKGIEGVLKVVSRLPYKLYVAGGGPLKEQFVRKYASDRIVFLGHLPAEKIISLLKRVRFTIISSVCYENNPLSVIESLCCGTPVVGRRMGGIPELIENNKESRIFVSDDELPDIITGMFSAAPADSQRLSDESCKRFSAERYYKEWCTVAEES